MLNWVRLNRWKSAILFSLIFLLVALPYLLQSIVVKTIQNYSQPYGIQQVVLDDIDFNPFTGQLAIYDLQLFRDKAAPTEDTSIQPVTHLGKLEVDLDPIALFKKRVHIQSLTFAQANFPLEIDAQNNVFLAGIPLTPSTEESDEPKSKSSMLFGLDQLNFEDIHVSLRYQEKTTQFHVRDLYLANLLTWSSNYARFIFTGRINNSPIASNLQLHLFTTEPKIVGTFKTKQLNSAEFKHLIPEQKMEFSTIFNSDITFTLQKAVQGLQLHQQGNIKLQNPSIVIDNTSAKLQSINWQGDLHFVDMPHQKITLDGKLKINNAELQQTPYAVKFASANSQGEVIINLAEALDISLNKNLSIKLLALKNQQAQQQLTTDINIASQANIELKEKQLKLKQQGQLTLSNLTAQQADNNATLNKLNWQGELDLTQAEKMNVSTVGKVSLQGLTGQYDNNQLTTEQLTIKQLKLQDLTKIELDQLLLTGIKAGSTLAVQSNIATENLSVANIALTDMQQLQTQNIQIRGFSAGYSGKKTGLSKVKKIDLSTTNFTFATEKQPGQLELGNLTVDSSETHLTLTKENEIQQVKALLAGFANKQPTTEDNKATEAKKQATTAEQPALSYSLASLTIRGKNPIYFTAQNIKPAISKTVQLDELVLGQLNSLSPNKASNYSLQVTLDEFSKLTSKGKITPLNPTHTVEANTQLEDLSLLEFTQVSENTVGYHIKSGQLTAELKTKLQNNLIDAENKLHLHKFELESMDSEKAQKLQADFPVPLETGLAMLQDKNDNIDLSLPVKGDISSPDFDINDVITKALGKALAGATRTYLLLALQPFGAIAMVGEMALDQAGAISLQAIEFKPTSKQITLEMNRYLKKLNKLLSERKKVQIKLCAGASEADRIALKKQLADAALKNQKAELEAQIKSAKNAQQRQAALQALQNLKKPDIKISNTQLLKLATERQKAIKRAMIKLGTDGKQIILCKPSILKDRKTAKVELTI